MPLIPYRSPDDPAFAVLDRSRFRVEHGTFFLPIGPLRSRVEAILESHRDWDLQIMKLVEENRRLRSCLEWLDRLGDDPDQAVAPPLEHEPALDLVANAMIDAREFARAICPECRADYPPEVLGTELWEFADDTVTVRGQKTLCPEGHILHALTAGIDPLDIEGWEATD